MSEKILWVVNYNKLDQFVKRAVAVGATGVAIRSDNDLAKAIKAFQAKNIDVFAWRWPSAAADPAMREADKIVGLLSAGLAGYYVDPEGAPGKPYNWDQNGLDKLADDFCSKIRKADKSKVFGVTSHYRAKKTFGKIPWAAFFKHATVLLPQAYWRSTEGTIGHGIPVDNYRRSIEFWTQAGGDPQKIVPMAGELGVSTAGEVNAYAKEANAQQRPMHFYTFGPEVKEAVWTAVANA